MSRLFFGVYCAFASVAAAAENANVAVVRDVPGLVAFWTFQEPPGHPREAVGVGRFPLRERGGAVARVEGGLFGPHAARLEYRQWFELPRDELGPLDIHGPGAEVTVVAWVRRGAKPDGYCEAIAGVWDEERRNRQYALFVAMPVPNADGVKQQVGGHVSSIGGPTPGFTASKSRANGATPVPRDGSRRTLGFTYDGETIRAYYDGRLDALEGVNPFDYPHGVYDGGAEGSSFTVGSVGRERRPVGPGNFFVGTLDGVAVFDRALTDAEMARLAALMPEQRRPRATGPSRFPPRADPENRNRVRDRRPRLLYNRLEKRFTFTREKFAMAAENETQDWPELAIGLYDKLTGRNAEITYEFENMDVHIPSGTSADAKHAHWKLNGTIKVRTKDGAAS